MENSLQLFDTVFVSLLFEGKMYLHSMNLTILSFSNDVIIFYVMERPVIGRYFFCIYFVFCI